MRFLSSTSCLSALLAMSVALTNTAIAQNKLVAKAERPVEMAGLYRVETPSEIAPHNVRFLRLLADGRARWETVDIKASAPTVKARATIGQFSENHWHLKSVGTGRAPHLCIPEGRSESCYAFHAETPKNDLLLFAPDANWGEPTIILRRERASNAH